MRAEGDTECSLGYVHQLVKNVALTRSVGCIDVSILNVLLYYGFARCFY